MGQSMRTFAKLLTSLLEQHYGQSLPYEIPAHVAAAALAGYKLLRLTKGYKADNLVDAVAYAREADRLAREYSERKGQGDAGRG